MSNIFLKKLNNLSLLLLKFPELKEIAKLLNKNQINWAIAAGSAYFLHYADKNEVCKQDEIDIFISLKNKTRAAETLKSCWIPKSSKNHKAENIEIKKLDFFTNCIKIKDGKILLHYLWSPILETKLEIIAIDKVDYKLVSREDILILKIPHPRNNIERQQVTKIISSKIDKNYLFKRLKECRAKPEVFEKLKEFGVIF